MLLWISVQCDFFIYFFQFIYSLLFLLEQWRESGFVSCTVINTWLFLFCCIPAAEMSGERAALYRQQSLPHRPVIPLVARMADQNTSGTPAMTEREASRLDKFRQLLAGPNTDLGKQVALSCVCVWYIRSLISSCIVVFLAKNFVFLKNKNQIW